MRGYSDWCMLYVRFVSGKSPHVMTMHKGWVALLFLLGACASVPGGGPADPSTPLLAPGEPLALPRPSDLGQSVEAAQLITASRDGQTFVFEGRISVTPERFLLVGVDSLGRRAMTVTWSDAGLEVETAPWLPPALRPGSMLADIVVLYWPEAVVRRALAPAGGTLSADAHRRSVRIDGKEVLHAERSWADGAPWTGTLRYANLAWGYEIEVQSMAASTAASKAAAP